MTETTDSGSPLDPPNAETAIDPEATKHSPSGTLLSPSSEFGFIGAYRLTAKLGEGGMGQVWLAEQTSPVKRQVALKVIKAGRFDQSALQRFDLERQALAIMDHPAIAKVFDAGSTAEGQPYFVMEYAPGRPITSYCDDKRLTTRERLELFIKVCEGIQHAHQKAIIHRDLKPSNILVVEVDGKPMPRIIDFGIAKATQKSGMGDEQTMFTQVGGMVGTPGYMSPEQADPGILDIDTRTDVYSLGVILYELLTGLPPFDPKQWKTKPFHEILRQLREDDPPRPSTRVGIDQQAMTPAAEHRRIRSHQLASLLRGDLDWITLKALEKDRARRYGTPSELAADIGRYLNNEPVVARPVSTTYKLKKYAQRHRAGVAVAAGLFLLVVGFGVTEFLQVRRITRERDRADRVTEFMTGMFKVSKPSESRGNSVTAREILDKASKDINSGLAKDPELQAKMMDVMGDVYDNLGLYVRAESLLQRAVDIRRRALGPKHPDTMTSMWSLAWVLRDEGRFAEAEKLQRETLDLRRRILGPNHPETLGIQSDLAATLEREGRYNESEKLHREVLYLRRRVLGREHRDTLASMHNLAGTLFDEDQYAEAESLERETLEIERRVLGADHPDTMRAMQLLALILSQQGRSAEAEMLVRDTVDIQRRVLGPEHPDTLTSMDSLAIFLSAQGRYAEAEKLERETLDLQRRTLGPDSPDAANVEYNLACMVALSGRRDEALALLRHSLEHGMPVHAMLHIAEDSDLKSLYADPRFRALAAEAKERATAQKPN